MMTEKNEKQEKSDEKYNELSKKYALPDSLKLSEDFDIEKVLQKSAKSKFLLRDIRKTMNDKLTSYLHLFETLANPSSAPIFIFSILKNIGEDDKKKVKEMYDLLAKVQIEVLKLDTVYSEEKEAEFIKKTYILWEKIKNNIFSLIETLEKGFDASITSVKRGYVG